MKKVSELIVTLVLTETEFAFLSIILK